VGERGSGRGKGRGRGTRFVVTDANDQGIGLPLDEAIIFWRRMYGASMTDDKFNKEYKYNIRHGYGQEGKRTNYPPKKWVPSFLPYHRFCLLLLFFPFRHDLWL
jgi:hypothetical protein